MKSTGETNNRAVEGFPLGDVISLKIGGWKIVCSELDIFVFLGRKLRIFMILPKKYEQK